MEGGRVRTSRNGIMSTIVQWAGFATSIGTLAAGFLWAGAMNTKVDTLWSIHLANATSRMERIGHIQEHSPQSIPDSTKAHLFEHRTAWERDIIVRFIRIIASRTLPENDVDLGTLLWNEMGDTTISKRASRWGILPSDYLSLLVISTREIERNGLNEFFMSFGFTKSEVDSLIRDGDDDDEK